LKDLKYIQSLFIDAQDWEEVSKLQFEIDLLPEELPKLKPEFMALVNKYWFDEMRSNIAKFIYCESRKNEIIKGESNYV